MAAENQTTAIMSGEDEAYGGLTNEEMRSSLEEAKDAILDKLSRMVLIYLIKNGMVGLVLMG